MTSDYLIIFDTETTGYSCHSDHVCQIAALKVSNQTLQIQDQFVSLVNPECDIPARATAVHGITNEMVSNAPTLQEVFRHKLLQWFSGTEYLCGHNVKFDVSMVRDALPSKGFNFMDTLTIARIAYPKLPNHKLSTLMSELKLPQRQNHDALSDTLTCLDFLQLIANGRSASAIHRHYNDSLVALKEKALNLGVQP